MAIISNPASFSSVRTAFSAEGYGTSTSFFAYRQGGGIVPATAPFNAIGAGTAGDPLRLSQFSGFTVPSQATVAIADLGLTAYVGETFNGEAYTSLTFNTDGTLYYYCYVIDEGPNLYTEIKYSSGAVIDSGGLSISGNVPGMWKLSGNASDYEIYVSKTGTYASISGASFNTWRNMSLGNITLLVQTAVNDAIGQTFTVQIRNASTLAVLDTATITMDALAAGIN